MSDSEPIVEETGRKFVMTKNVKLAVSVVVALVVGLIVYHFVMAKI